MSDCDRFNKILDSMTDGNISEEDRTFLDLHASVCEKCSEELAFVSNINKALHTMPKIEVPDNFLSSLNERLDFEEKIKKNSSNIINRKIFGNWKKYSALTACLLLAVMARLDVWEVSAPDKVGEPVIDYTVTENEAISPAPQATQNATYTAPEAPLPQENVTSAQPIAENSEEIVRNTVSSAAENSKLQQMPVSKTQPKAEVPKPAAQKPVVLETEPTEVVVPEAQKPTKVIVINPGTPHSRVNPPEYINDPDVEVTYSEPIEHNVVKLHDYASVSDEAIEKAFGITDLPENKVVVATPNVMEAAVKAANEINNSINMVSINTYGVGSLYVADSDKDTACQILNRYINASADVKLSEENYSLFLKELDSKGIRYKKYIVNTKSSTTSVS